MKTKIAALTLMSAALLSACSPSTSRVGTGPLVTEYTMVASANNKTILYDTTYTRTQAKSFPLIDSWIFNKTKETPLHWTKRLEIQRYKKVNADEIYAQMKDAVDTQLNQYDDKSRTICFVTERKEGQLKEVNIWKYADAEGSTYANGIAWQFPASAAFNTFMKGEFTRTCNAMRTHTLITPPKL